MAGTAAARDIVCFVAEKIGRPDVSHVQLDIIDYLSKGQDVFVCLPTGSGKSLTYIAAPCVFQWAKIGRFIKEPCEIVIVGSPLVAIMREQVNFLTEKGLNTVYISEENCDLGRLQPGNYNYVYGSPEGLKVKQRKLLASNVYRKKLCAVFIDESHCILKWFKKVP